MNTRNIPTRLLFISAQTIPNEAERLRYLSAALRDRLNVARRNVERRLELHRRIAECAECAEDGKVGKVALIESGCDCDGVVYGGRVHIVDAHWRAVLAKEHHIGQWADGPFNLRIERPTIAEEIEYHSRDLGAEAFENGHAHSLHV